MPRGTYDAQHRLVPTVKKNSWLSHWSHTQSIMCQNCMLWGMSHAQGTATTIFLTTRGPYIEGIQDQGLQQTLACSGPSDIGRNFGATWFAISGPWQLQTWDRSQERWDIYIEKWYDMMIDQLQTFTPTHIYTDPFSVVNWGSRMVKVHTRRRPLVRKMTNTNNNFTYNNST